MKRQMMVRIKEVKYMLRLENVNRILASVSEENNLKNRITINYVISEQGTRHIARETFHK